MGDEMLVRNCITERGVKVPMERASEFTRGSLTTPGDRGTALRWSRFMTLARLR